MMQTFRLWIAAGLIALVQFAGQFSVHSAELIMLEQEGCAWCDRWDEEIGEIYPKTDEGKRAPLRKVDIHESLPADIAEMKTGNFTPTFVLMDEGKEIGRIRGYPGEDFFWGLLAQIMKKLPKQTGDGAAAPEEKEEVNG